MGLTQVENGRVVAVYEASAATYSEEAPFHPSEAYPEYSGEVSSSSNPAYAAVRGCFAALGLDADRFGTSAWDPLCGLIQPGETVLLKPNLVKEAHPRDPEGWRYVLTHGSVIRAVADYVWKALRGRGRIVVADAPQTDSSLAAMVALLGLDRIARLYRASGLDFRLVDLRREEWLSKDNVVVERRLLPGDPAGYVAFDLGGRSAFSGHRGAGRYYGADYDDGEVNRHHSDGRHEYLVAGSAMRCDVVFNLPKLKTHKKVGVTLGLKNLVGINGDKNWLPHHTEGHPRNGGDEHPRPSFWHRLERAAVAHARGWLTRAPSLAAVYRRVRPIGIRTFGDTETVVRSGNWAGNDTAWRMCLDLNKIVLYGSADGTLPPGSTGSRRRHFVLVDGIIGGEGRGPMNPDPVPAGIVVFGVNPASVDATCAYLMGFDPERIPLVREAFADATLPIADWGWRDVHIVSNRAAWSKPLPEISDEETFHFAPHFGWRGYIERSGSRSHANRNTLPTTPDSRATSHV